MMVGLGTQVAALVAAAGTAAAWAAAAWAAAGRTAAAWAGAFPAVAFVCPCRHNPGGPHTHGPISCSNHIWGKPSILGIKRYTWSGCCRGKDKNNQQCSSKL